MRGDTIVTTISQEESTILRTAIFLDRDGVIIENRDDYVRHVDDVAFIPAAINALLTVERWDCVIVMVTNQACVGKGIISLADAQAINHHIIEHVRSIGGRIDAAYLCPHRADERCQCRKPKPGMLLKAARDLNLGLAGSIMIGDAITDMEAARAAGVSATMVRTGRGARELAAFTHTTWFSVADDLGAALAHMTPTSI